MKTSDNAEFHIVLVKGFVEKDGKYLLARRSKRELQSGGEWSLPGGKMEKVDGVCVIEKHLKEEIREEVGVEVSEEMDFLCGRGFTRVDQSHVVSLTFLTHFISGEARPLEDTEEVAWHSLRELQSLHDLPSYIMDEVKALARYVERCSFKK